MWRPVGPASAALECRNDVITYGDINQRANQLARYLASRRFEAPSRVAILMNRSVDLIVAILTVMKAGAAYIPLDPSFPTARLAFMVADAEVSLIISEYSLRASVVDLPARVLVLEEATEELAAFPDSGLSHHRNSHDLAYVMYTSGTVTRKVSVSSIGTCSRI
jgi:non-ribosomal peptide synthetase component F